MKPAATRQGRGRDVAYIDFQVGHLMGEYCVAMEFGGASEDVAHTCRARPTRSEVLRQEAIGVEAWTMQA